MGSRVLKEALSSALLPSSVRGMGTGQPGVGSGVQTPAGSCEPGLCMCQVHYRVHPWFLKNVNQTRFHCYRRVWCDANTQALRSGCHLSSSLLWLPLHTPHPTPQAPHSSGIRADSPVRVLPHLLLAHSHISRRTRRRMAHEGVLSSRLFHRILSYTPFCNVLSHLGLPGPAAEPQAHLCSSCQEPMV